MRSLFVLTIALMASIVSVSAQHDKKTYEFDAPKRPLDDITTRTAPQDRMVLQYAPIREADILYEKRIWREIDIREKMNHRFAYPEEPFFKILKDGIEAGTIEAYSAVDDKFTTPLQTEELALQFYKKDTVEVTDPLTGHVTFREIEEEINPLEIKRYRLKEVWFFDSNLSRMRVRILGIAPVREVYDDHGNFLYEYPLFWIYYPHARGYLAQFKVFNSFNDSSSITWDDLMESRHFASYIIKQSNVHDRRLQDMYTGRDLLLEAEKVKMEIFNFEHDLWSY